MRGKSTQKSARTSAVQSTMLDLADRITAVAVDPGSDTRLSPAFLS